MINKAKIWRWDSTRNIYKCDADCTSWSYGMCQCGLIAHMVWNSCTEYISNHAYRRHEIAKSHLYNTYLAIKDKLLETKCEHDIDFDEKCKSCSDKASKLIESIFGSE